MKRVKGNTLVEVMIALALTSFAATLAVVIFLNIQKSTIPFFKIKASGLATKYMEQTLMEKDFFDRQQEVEGFFLKKKVLRHPGYPDCNTITITVFDSDKKKLAEIQTSVFTD